MKSACMNAVLRCGQLCTNISKANYEKETFELNVVMYTKIYQKMKNYWKALKRNKINGKGRQNFLTQS